MKHPAVRYHVLHETRYSYESPVSLSRQLLHLTPRECLWQHCLEHAISVSPEPSVVRERTDCFGNAVRELALEFPHDDLQVHAESTIDVFSRSTEGASPDSGTGTHRCAADEPDTCLPVSPAWEAVRDALAYGARPVLLEASRFQFESPHVRVKREFARYARESFDAGRPLFEAVHSLMSRIHEEFSFDPEATTVATPVLEVLAERRGVCQDFAHLMLSCLRSLGLAARYVSGYLLTHPPPGQPRMVGADASHAWVSVYSPSDGEGNWVDFDPTNCLLPDVQHITLAWGRDFADVSPLRGVILGGDTHELEVAVTVTPLADAS
ncbi:transglutaminase family protein [Accumulibacter sp.]|uniref:transglutaminase family protein n=1 Tax=Accumulibacter sp. TaxID=2053492 RepID=UPI0025F6B40F|nr:transglutaminase family protein [Accumulibacter sp.]MCM8596574.1 transglutaminase family protein [Accumulibacter sp.]MDS4050722.1 transglutaminase family protein [Accumulibacter sp.]